jgi:C1A family cysteine protease
MTDIIKRLGWKPDKPDHRDFKCSLGLRKKKGVDPNNTDLRKTKLLPNVYNQGETNSCTAQGLAAAVHFSRKQQAKRPDFAPSRLFIYWNERALIGEEHEDNGAMIRDGIKALAKWGVPPEPLWPFEADRVTMCPSTAAYGSAVSNVIKKYERVQIYKGAIQNVLTYDVPIVFGLQLFDNFMSEESEKTGWISDPYGDYQGGHAMVIVGSTSTHFIVRNSWGDNWGDNGYCYIPHTYICNYNLASDFWAIFTA